MTLLGADKKERDRKTGAKTLTKKNCQRTPKILAKIIVVRKLS
jgi:hypothetical protein